MNCITFIWLVAFAPSSLLWCATATCDVRTASLPLIVVEDAGGQCPSPGVAELRDELKQNVSILLQDVMRGKLATTPEHPASSCAEIAEQRPDCPSGNYYVLNSAGSAVLVFCEIEKVYRDCTEAYENGSTVSGVYTIQPDDGPPFAVYCDMDTDGGGWTVFQRRKDGSEDFYRDWVDYEEGFGSLTGEFWLGLETVHIITDLSSGPERNELRVDMEDFEENIRYAQYGIFSIGNATTKYTLTVGGYTGTAGDSLTSFHDGHKFSTRDQDNDVHIHGGSCAQDFSGAWWYSSCHYSNLNGLYLGGAHSSWADGVNWLTWRGHYYSLKFTEMKVRRQ